MLDLRVALPIALWLAVTACGPGPNELIDQWRGAQRIVTFEGESKHAITPDFPSSLGFEATLPSEPFLEFAIAVDAPRDLSRGQVRFTVRLRADTKTFVVFDEVVRARRGPRWHDRRINLAAWRDRDVELVLEARPADPSAVGAWADRVRIAWGDPVVSNYGLDTVARPSVVFVLVDTLRRDHLGVYGFAGGISPNIDWLAKESVLFDNAFSQAPWTKPSIATLFTSVHPDVHGLDNHGGLFGERNNELLTTGVLSSETVTMAEVFQSEGYRTAAFVANPWLDAPFGFDQGFGRYEILRDGNIILQEARDWLETTDGEPFFLYLHFMDVHSPYDAPEDDFEEMRESSSLEVTQSPPRDVLERLPPYLDGISWFGPEELTASGWGGIINHRLGRSRTIRARYAANVRAFDRLIGPFLQQIRNSELGRTAYVVLTSDHGEELLEHVLFITLIRNPPR